MEHHFNTSLAKKYSIEQAIIISNFDYWILKNARNKRHFYDGRYWTYNSIVALAGIFIYMNSDKMRRTIERMVNNCILLKGNYNFSGYDRTTWYSFTDEFILSTSIILGYCEFHLADLPNPLVKIAKPIPYIKPDTKPFDIIYPFEDFWNLYDKKVGDKEKLIKKWDRLPEMERKNIIEYIPRYKKSQPDKKFRKNPQTFLNNKSWNDELINSSEVMTKQVPKINDIWSQ